MKKVVSRIFLSLNILLVCLMVLASGLMLYVKKSNPPTLFKTSFYIISESGGENSSLLVGVKKQSYSKPGETVLIGSGSEAFLKRIEKVEGEKIFPEGFDEPISASSAEYLGTVSFENEFWGRVFAFASDEQNFSLVLIIIGAAFVFLLIVLVLTFALTSRKYIDENADLDNEHQQIEVLKLMQDGTGEIPVAKEEKRNSPFQDPLGARGFTSSLSYIAKEAPPPAESESISVEELVNEAISNQPEEIPAPAEIKPESEKEPTAPPAIEEIKVEPDYSKLFRQEVEEQTKVYVLRKDRGEVDTDGVKLYVKGEAQKQWAEEKPSEALKPDFERSQAETLPTEEKQEADLSSIYSMLDEIEENFKRTFDDDDE